MANEIEKSNTNLPEEKVYQAYTKVIHSSDPNLKIPFNDVLDKVLGFINVNDIVENIQKGSEYVVQIPAEFQRQYESGEYWIMKNSETGKEWPTLVRMGEDSRQKIVTPLSIKKESFIQGNPVQDLTQQFQMARLQSTIQEQTQLLETICKGVKHIQNGQMNDRIALIEAGKKEIAFALQRSESDPHRQTAIEFGISQLCLGQEQIYAELKLQIEGFDIIPKQKILQLAQGIVHSDYWDRKSEEYNSIVDLFELYRESTKYIAAAHILINEPQVVETVYSDAFAKLKELDYSNVQSIENMYSDEDYSFFFKKDSKLLKKDKKECIKLSEKYEGLAIEVSGEQLLEAINHERERNESQSQTAQKESENC